MYKRVSIALAKPEIALSLRLVTLVFLVSLAIAKSDGLSIGSFSDLHFTFPLIALAGLLSFFNLGTEALKYQVLFGREGINFPMAFRSFLSGMAVGIWTPNRVGEVIGRIKSAPSGRKKQALEASVLGSFLQGSVTLTFGCWVLLVGVDLPNPLMPYASWIYALAGSALLILFGLSILRKSRSTKPSVLLEAFCLAFMRYLIFATQFAIVLFSFGFNGTLVEAFLGIGILYLLQSFIPGSFLSELGIREVLSILIFSDYFDQPMAAPLAAFSLWIINIGMPVIFWAFTKRKEEGA